MSSLKYAYDGIKDLLKETNNNELKVPKKFQKNKRYSQYETENFPKSITTKKLNQTIIRLNKSFVDLEIHLRSLENTLLFLNNKTPKLELISHNIKKGNFIDFLGHILMITFSSLLLLIFSIILTKKSDD